MLSDRPRDEVAELLGRATSGDTDASEKLFHQLYATLHALAQGQMRRSAPGETLQPTALVHEAWLRLVGDRSPSHRSRAHFFAAAAKAMRCALLDQARRRRTLRRGGQAQRVPLFETVELFEDRATDLIELNDALERLAKRDERQARVVELRFFGGLSMAEAASMLDVSLATAERIWYLARGWLRTELQG